MSSVDWKEKKVINEEMNPWSIEVKFSKTSSYIDFVTTCLKLSGREKTLKTKLGHNTAKNNERSACAWKIWTGELI